MDGTITSSWAMRLTTANSAAVLPAPKVYFDSLSLVIVRAQGASDLLERTRTRERAFWRQKHAVATVRTQLPATPKHCHLSHFERNNNTPLSLGSPGNATDCVRIVEPIQLECLLGEILAPKRDYQVLGRVASRFLIRHSLRSRGPCASRCKLNSVARC